MERHFAFPYGDFYCRRYLTRSNQTRAVAAGIEHWRAHWPVCAGAVMEVGAARVALEVGPRAVAVVDVPEGLQPEGPSEFLVADADGLRALFSPAPDREPAKSLIPSPSSRRPSRLAR